MWLALLLAALAGSATDVRQKLSGTVTDQTGRVVAGAVVELWRLPEGKVSSTHTGAPGDFQFDRLPSGDYLISASAPGFDRASQRVSLTGRDAEVELRLRLEQQRFAIDVEEKRDELDTDPARNQDALILDVNDLANLPIKDGDVVAALTALVNPTGGAPPSMIVDGIERTDFDLPPSSIEEIRINTNTYSAEFGKPGKERIEIKTKGGTDKFHGGLSLRARDSRFDARNPMAVQKLPFSRHTYDLNLSGPIARTGVSFFVGANREQRQQSQPVFALLPSGPFRVDVLSPATKDRLNGRLDWRLGERHRISARYELHQDASTNDGIGGFNLPERAQQRYKHDYRIEFSDQIVLSQRTLNHFRIAIGRNFERRTASSDQQSVVVHGAFSGGGAQTDEWRREPKNDLQDVFTIARGNWAWKLGADAKLHPFRKYDARNFRGTYEFASLADYLAGKPLLYTVNSGIPLLEFRQDDYAWFAQHERRLLPNLSLSAGVRHEFQSEMDQRRNMAPRFALAYSPGKQRRTVLRLGAGFFYDRRPPHVLEQSLRFDGLYMRQVVVRNPSFPVEDALPGPVLPTNVYQLERGIRFPRVIQFGGSIERRLPHGFIAAADYTSQRGTHLFRTRNLNAPLPGTETRPDPSRSNVNQIESSASSRLHAFTLSARSPGKKAYQFFAQYSLAWAWNDTGGMLSFPANNYDLGPEWGRSDNDLRQRLSLAGHVKLPKQLTLGLIAAIHSGPPYNITTGRDDNHDTVVNDRPAGVARNSGQGPGAAVIDLHLGRKLSFQRGERKLDLELSADSFNFLNRTNLGNYVGVLTSPLFGLANSAGDARQMQFALQVKF